MTTRILTGNYKYGYAIGAFTTLSVTASGYISNNGSLSYYAALYGKSSVTVVNAGVIKGTHIEYGGTPDSTGVVLIGVNSVLVNSGTISGTEGVTLVGANSSVINNGGITGVYGGVILRGVESTVTNGGVISGGRVGVSLQGTASSVVNHGVIAGGYRGISSFNGGTVVNFGEITGGSGGQAAGVVLGGYGGSIANYGTILGGAEIPLNGQVAAIGSIVNGSASDTTALIEGVYGVEAGTVTNFGTIEGGDYVGAHLVNGSAADTGALVSGDVFMGLDADTGPPETMTNFGTVGGVYQGAGGLVTNGTVVDTTAIIDVYGVATSGAASYTAVINFGTIFGYNPHSPSAGVILGHGGGRIVNGSAQDTSALIAGEGGGIFIDGTGMVTGYNFTATVANYGTIRDGVAVYARGLVTNGSMSDRTALITSSGYRGCIAVDGGVTIANFATISGGPGAMGIGADLVLGCTLTNGAAGDPHALIANKLGVRLAGGNTVTNFGTISGSGGTAVLLESSADAVVVEAGCAFVGAVIGAGGLLDLGSGVGTLSGNLASGSVTVSGSMAPTTFTSFDTVEVSSGARFTVAGILAIAAGQNLIDAGALTVAGAVVNAGAVTLASSGPAADLFIGANTTLSGGGTVALSNSHENLIEGAAAGAVLTNVDNTISGAGGVGGSALTLVNEAAGIIDASASTSLILGTGTATIANAGLIEATGTGGLSLRSAVNNAGGGVIAAAGGGVFLQGADILGGTLRSTGGKIIFAKTGVNTLDGTASAVNVQCRVVIDNGQNLNLAGAIDNTSLLDLISNGSPTKLTIAAAGATLTGGGQVFLGNDNPAAEIVGASASATLTNLSDVIAGAGDLGGGRLTLINEMSGCIDGENAAPLIIDTGSNTIVNAGRIENAGKGGTIVQSAVANTGWLVAEGGTLTVNGAVTGSGEAVIYGGTLDFTSSFSQIVVFKATSGVLELARSQSYLGTVYDFSKAGGTSLDLRDIVFGAGTTATYSGTTSSGVLTVTDGTHAAHITLSGDYRASTFIASSDGHGGTSIVDPTKAAGESAAPPHAFIAAMAGLASRAGATIQTSHPMQIHEPMLVRPRAAIA